MLLSHYDFVKCKVLLKCILIAKAIKSVMNCPKLKISKKCCVGCVIKYYMFRNSFMKRTFCCEANNIVGEANLLLGSESFVVKRSVTE